MLKLSTEDVLLVLSHNHDEDKDSHSIDVGFYELLLYKQLEDKIGLPLTTLLESIGKELFVINIITKTIQPNRVIINNIYKESGNYLFGCTVEGLTGEDSICQLKIKKLNTLFFFTLEEAENKIKSLSEMA